MALAAGDFAMAYYGFGTAVRFVVHPVPFATTAGTIVIY